MVAGTCDNELTATYLASQNPQEWGEYSGGNVKCPFKSECNGRDCRFENQRTIYIRQQGKASRQPTQMEKFYAKGQRSLDMIQARSGS